MKSIDPHVTVRQKHIKKSADDGYRNRMVNMLIRMAAAVILGAAAYLVHSGTIEFFLFLGAYLIIGGDIIIRAVKNIIRGQVFDEHFLMALATIGAFLIQQYPEGSPLCCFIKSVSFFKEPR